MVRDRLRVAVVDWPDGLDPAGGEWPAIAGATAAAAPDLLVTNELPFGPWLAAAPTFDGVEAQCSIEEHRAGVQALADLGIPAIISSRAAPEGDRSPRTDFGFNDR